MKSPTYPMNTIKESLTSLILVGSIWGVFFMFYAITGEKLPNFTPIILIALAIYVLLHLALVTLSILTRREATEDSYDNSELIKYLHQSRQFPEIEDKLANSEKM